MALISNGGTVGYSTLFETLAVTPGACGWKGAKGSLVTFIDWSVLNLSLIEDTKFRCL
jgi:hypothetical protein